MQMEMLSGNEAVARGVYEAGCHVAAAYPGTPSTEILENIGQKYKDKIYCQWACNEKTAVEIASGASIGGARAFAAMKHVGMNVAADPIFTMAYSGVNGGFVFVSADDPGCHSSQNEQDNRLYAPHAKIAMMEPSDSAECRDFAKAAFDISERFDTLVMLRMTTRVCHSKSLVKLEERQEVPVKKYVRDPKKNAMLPAHARARHIYREEMLKKLEEYSNDCPFNRVEANGAKIGVVTSGIAYEHAKEVFGNTVDYLKLGLTYPLPRRLMADFCSKYDTIYVIEENDPYLEDAVHALGFTGAIGKARLPICDELNARIIRDAFLPGTAEEGYEAAIKAPARPPVLCAGCPHRGFFFALTKYLNKSIVPIGDIGCYTLGINPPLNALDATICMGSGISSIIGLAKALEMQGDTRKALGCLGDSTFFHSGMTSLMDVVAADANVIACILDNSITAMTGHQDNPGTTRNLMGELSPALDIEKLALATGLARDRVVVVDPLDIEAVRNAVEAGLSVKGPFVIITRRPCALIKEVQKQNAARHCEIDGDKCRGCKQCMKIACPAIEFENGKARIFDTASCTGCGLCMHMCKFGAIERKEK
ncbi:MAG: indolepyruvate ferredoxin oxidoreductase subunit alpha [Clostridiales bacterium]|jgi:indolepyruvate ferredoxin oxidoreductase alpha subunit|nr:indolepyruvate ferredoxin oxidoreductase subunit alpha [Clostridiales bacterium]MDD6721634.1 indolepyruvate ferredoxin oxidoreductase subunit alpha [Clostridiales bacterium]